MERSRRKQGEVELSSPIALQPGNSDSYHNNLFLLHVPNEVDEEGVTKPTLLQA